MAVTELDDGFSTTSVTLTNANEAYVVQVPNRAGRVSIYFVTNAGFFAASGTEGVTLPTKMPIAADSWLELKITGLLYLESASAGTVVHVVVKPDGTLQAASGKRWRRYRVGLGGRRYPGRHRPVPDRQLRYSSDRPR